VTFATTPKTSKSKLHVRFGSLADILTSPRHVRFTPNNGRWTAHPNQHFGLSVYEYTPLVIVLSPQEANELSGDLLDFRGGGHYLGRFDYSIRRGHGWE
jgi:hypothetical protein